MSKRSITFKKVKKKNNSKIELKKQNSKDTKDCRVNYNKENNKIKEGLNSTNFFIDEIRSKSSQTTGEYIFNFSQRENLNKIKAIKHNKIKKNKNTPKIGKDRIKNFYFSEKSRFITNKNCFSLKNKTIKFIRNNNKSDKKYYKPKKNEKITYQKIIYKDNQEKDKKFTINKTLENKRIAKILYEINTSENKCFFKFNEKKSKNKENYNIKNNYEIKKKNEIGNKIQATKEHKSKKLIKKNYFKKDGIKCFTNDKQIKRKEIKNNRDKELNLNHHFGILDLS